MAPVLVGLLLSAPLTVLTSRASVGHRLRERGYFLTPEETNTPVELLGIEAVNTPEYHQFPDDDFHPVPAHAPLRMEPAPLDRYSFPKVTRRQAAPSPAEPTTAALPAAQPAVAAQHADQLRA
jgi:membrane glycosyltransferase